MISRPKAEASGLRDRRRGRLSRRGDSAGSGLAPSGRSTLRTTILLLIWAAGASIVLGRMLLGLVAVWWMSRRTRERDRAARGCRWRAALAADLGLTHVRFVQSATASMPMAWGVLRASVLMPADADSVARRTGCASCCCTSSRTSSAATA